VTLASACGIITDKAISKVKRFLEENQLTGTTKRSPIPYFVFPSALIAIWPFRYLWNNPPQFVGNHVWLAIVTALVVYFAVVIALTSLMTICWVWWQSN
jgi:hypothetical protein